MASSGNDRRRFSQPKPERSRILRFEANEGALDAARRFFGAAEVATATPAPAGSSPASTAAAYRVTRSKG
jgi:hypothetical protein